MERNGSLLRLTEDGKGLLYARYIQYQKVLDTEVHEIHLHGRITSGLGEGKYYMRLDGYRNQFIEKMGFQPYPGTLNIKIAPAEISRVLALKYMHGTVIKGFTEHGRTFGDVIAYPARVKGLPCVLIFPVRGHYTDTIEIISKDFLRKKLSLRDGDEVEVSISIP